MLGTLIESTRRVDRRGVSGIVSFAFHVAAGIGLVVAGRTAAASIQPVRTIDTIIWPILEGPAPQARTNGGGLSPATSADDEPIARGPLFDPALPTIDGLERMTLEPGRVALATSFGRELRSRSGPLCTMECAVGPPLGSVASEDQVDEPARPTERPEPEYPPILRAAGFGGDVVIEFVVDTIGQVEPGSARILAASHREFALSATTAIHRWRFVPAVVRGRYVRQLVRQRLVFRIR